MKKTLLVLFSLILAYSAFTREAVVSFKPKVDTVSIDSVHVTNLTRGQSVKLASGEAVVFNLVTSVDYKKRNSTDNGFLYPNPFNEYTILNFNTSKKQEVLIAVYSLSGKLLSNNTHSLPPGNHKFQLRFPTGGLYNILVFGNREPLSFKAVNTGKSQQEFKISYVGSEHLAAESGQSGRLKSAQNVKSLDYSEGDVVHYTVYSGDNVTVIPDEPVTSKTIKVDFYECRDPDNRNYKIVQIGDQWWMAENLAYLPKLESSVSDPFTEPYYYVYGYTGNSISEAKATNIFKIYGVWYNWPAALEACPVGWHLPGDAEWAQLESYLAENGYNYDGSIGDGRDKIAKSLAASIYWDSSADIGAIGNNLSINDKSGFSGLPGGYCDYLTISIYQGQNGYWWSSTEREQFTAWVRSLSYTRSDVARYGFNFLKSVGTNVRCVKDENTP